jgi:tetratricopeptide (TPR) repeat protein
MSARLTQDESLFFEGNIRMEAGDDEGAERCFRLALAISQDFAEALANLGWLREKAGAVEEAEVCYRRSIAIRPDIVQPYLIFGVLLMNGRRFAESVLRPGMAI